MPKGHASQTVKEKRRAKLPTPLPCSASKHEPERWVNLSAVPKDKRAAVWSRLEQSRPETADMLKHDENWKALRDRFGGAVHVKKEV